MAPPGKGPRRPAALEPVSADWEAAPVDRGTIPATPRAVSVDLPITLGQFLKVARFASSGGEAKYLIAVGMVRVNGEAEQRRGRKLVSGDAVEVAGTVAVVSAASADTTLGTRP